MHNLNTQTWLRMHQNKAIALILVAQCTLSFWQSLYSIDPHHWGLMLSNAKDLASGKAPYSDIFIQYGFLTTFIHVAGFLLFNESIQGIICLTILSYAIGIWFIFLTAKQLYGQSLIPLAVIILIVLFHPIVIYPWSNYVAFPFLTSALFIYINSPTYLGKLLSGILFGCACLAREGLFLALIVFIANSGILSIIFHRRVISEHTKFLFFVFLGLALPLLGFILYLSMAGLLDFWLILSYQLPKLYTTWFPHMASWNVFDLLTKSAWNGLINFNIRWILIDLIIVTCIVELIKTIKNAIIGISAPDNTLFLSDISILSLTLLSSALHSPEFFRLGTGTIIGILVLFKIIQPPILKIIIFATCFVLSLSTIFSSTTGNIFIPTKEQISTATSNESIKYFRHQQWTPEVQDYYQQIAVILDRLPTNNCGLIFHYNDTKDAFLDVLSPFSNASFAPFHLPMGLIALRKDRESVEKLAKKLDLVLFKMAQTKELAIDQVPLGFVTLDPIAVPRMIFIPDNAYLFILVPKKCL